MLGICVISGMPNLNKRKASEFERCWNNVSFWRAQPAGNLQGHGGNQVRALNDKRQSAEIRDPHSDIAFSTEPVQYLCDRSLALSQR
jgi:hypothetical protein